MRFNTKVKSYLGKADYVDLPCDYCQGRDFDILSRKDRYGLKIKTVICRDCGLIFINPRMSDLCYEDFYRAGFYRQLLDYYKRREFSYQDELEKEFVRGRELGLRMADELGVYLDEGLTIEIGSSCGGILSGLKDALPKLDVLGIEPSVAEASFANAAGIKTLNQTNILGAETLPLASNLFVVRSLNHLPSPREFFILARKQLKQNGKLVVVVIDFANFCKRRSKILTQVDHPFMFTPATLRNFVESSGFQVVLEHYSAESDYIKIVAVKKDIQPFLNIKTSRAEYLAIRKNLKMTRLDFRAVFRNIFS